MQEQLDIIAAWWIPGKESNYIMGRLTFSEAEGGGLELWGHFDQSERFSRKTHFTVLNGVSTEAQQITLQECSWAGMEHPSPGVPKVKFRVEIVYIGHLFGRLREIKFKKLYVCYSDMHAWVRESAFTVNPKYRKESFSGSDVRVRMPKKKTVLKTDAYKVQVVFGLSGPLWGTDVATAEIAIRQHVEFLVTFKGAIPFDQNLDVLHYLHGFYSFCAGARIATVSLRGRRKAGFKEVSIKIYYRSNRRGDPSQRIKSENMLLTLPAAGASIGDMFLEWIKRGSDIRPIYDMYLSFMYAQEMYAEFRFLSMVQAVESLLRYLEGNAKANWSIEKKMPDLIARHSSLSMRLIQDATGFAKSVAISRHYYSHRNLSQQRLALRGAELASATNVLQMLLEMDFLRLIGADEKTIERAMYGKYQMIP